MPWRSVITFYLKWQKAVLSGLAIWDIILYRQTILKDCLKHPSIVSDIYHIAINENQKKALEGGFDSISKLDTV